MPFVLLKNILFTQHPMKEFHSTGKDSALNSTGKESAAILSRANFLNPTGSEQSSGHLYFKIFLLIEVAMQKEYCPNKA